MGLSILSKGDSYKSDPRNPNPLVFEILRIRSINQFVIALVHYIGCSHFEGRKILVFKDTSAETVRARSCIDPHFMENSDLVARFVPTVLGWKMALAFATTFGTEMSSQYKRPSHRSPFRNSDRGR